MSDDKLEIAEFETVTVDCMECGSQFLVAGPLEHGASTVACTFCKKLLNCYPNPKAPKRTAGMAGEMDRMEVECTRCQQKFVAFAPFAGNEFTAWCMNCDAIMRFVRRDRMPPGIEEQVRAVDGVETVHADIDVARQRVLVHVVPKEDCTDYRELRWRLWEALAYDKQDLTMDFEVGRPFDKIAADMMAAAVDFMIHRGLLDARCVVADARLDYGEPFSKAEAEERVRAYQEGRHGQHG